MPGTVSGPLFDGRADAAMAIGVEAVRRAIAAEAEKAVIASFNEQIRVNHGTFIHSIHTEAAITDLAVTTDIATYGPWLEGVSSRNETTRFKGYHGFRQAAQELDITAEAQAALILAPYIARCSE